MKTDILIIGAGPAGIFTAMELIRRGSRKKIVLAEKGQAVENRRYPKSRTGKCMNCRPNCHITTGFSGAGAFSDGKLSLSCEVGGDLPTLIGELVESGELNVSVLRCDAQWFGVTYQEDKPPVQEALRELHAAGVYPASLRD